MYGWLPEAMYTPNFVISRQDLHIRIVKIKKIYKDLTFKPGQT